MISLTSTYRQDYTYPENNRYAFLKTRQEKNSNYDCICSKPKDDSQHISKASEVAEWTGIAPMGMLVEPRLIPPNYDLQHTKTYACKSDELTKQYLTDTKMCCSSQGQKQPPINVGQIDTHCSGCKRSTYQAHYCKFKECTFKPDCKKNKGNVCNKKSKELPCNKGKKHDSCSCNVFISSTKNSNQNQHISEHHIDCKKDKKEQIFYGRAKADQQLANEGNKGKTIADPESHWDYTPDFVKLKRFSEYQDTINRIGCIISCNDMHNHRKCRMKHVCRHVLNEDKC